MSGSITVGGKILASHDNVSGKLSMSGDVVFPAGHVVQVKYYENDNPVTAETTNTTIEQWYDLVVNASIIPINPLSKILVSCSASGAGPSTGYEISYRLLRSINGSSYTPIGGNMDPNNLALSNYILMTGAGSGEGPYTVSNRYLDSPNTEYEIIYKLQLASGEVSTVYGNRAYSTNSIAMWSNAGNSTITLMEITNG
jgi:hypothetical protein